MVFAAWPARLAEKGIQSSMPSKTGVLRRLERTAGTSYTIRKETSWKKDFDEPPITGIEDCVGCRRGSAKGYLVAAAPLYNGALP